MQFPIIDAHVHCGKQFTDPPQAFEDYLAHLGDSGIIGAVMFPPVMEIYDRHNPDFEDDPQWRRKRQNANEYILTLGNGDFEVFPFFFIWNDFAVDQLSARHRGIKWHRHSNEPRYRYEDPRCVAAIDEIRRRNMPVCLEEELDNTLRFVNDLAPDVRVIIPHCGYLNGGYEKLCDLGIWERPNIFTDTSASGASPETIADYVQKYGHTRIMFGSDFPFGHPKAELEKILQLKLSKDAREAILGLNTRRLLADSNRQTNGA